MNSCPCCNQQMVLFAGKNRLYWFCDRCHQEMPDLLSVMMTARQNANRRPTVSLSKGALA